MSFRVGNLLAVVAVSGLIVGCGGSHTPQAFNTPEECFQFAQKAAAQKDYAAAVDCMTVDTQETMAGMMVVAGSMTKAFAGMATAFGGNDEDVQQVKKGLEKIDAVLEKHGISEKTLEEAGENMGLASAFGGEPNSDQALEGIRKIAAPVKDHRAFVAEMITALDSIGDDAGENPVQGFVGELTNVQINGDTATATIKTSTGEQNPIGFKKTARGWRIHLDANMLQQQPTSTTTTF